MKELYAIKNYNEQRVIFEIIKIYEETETDYIVDTDMCDLIKNAGFSFPKSKINTILKNGFVTDDINNKKLKKELDRIYQNIDKSHIGYIEQHSFGKKINDASYNASIKEIEQIRNKLNI